MAEDKDKASKEQKRPRLHSGIHSLGELFSQNQFYEIPYFQRPFSWDDDNFIELVDDLKDADRTKEYFLGNIVFYPDNGAHMVVDGQQRLTSLMILLACLRDLIEDEELKKNIQDTLVSPKNKMMRIDERSRLLVKDTAIYERVVVTSGGTTLDLDARDYADPENRYIRAKAIFRSALETLSQKELSDLLDFMTHNCVMVYLSAANFDEAFKLFEIVNDRGKQLRRIELLKSHNLSKEFVASDALAQKLAASWEEDEASIGERTFESIFHMVRLALTREKPEEDLYKEFRKKIIGKSIKPGQSFFNEVSAYVDLYSQIFRTRDYLNGDPKDQTFRALIKIMDDELKTFEWRACVLAYAKKYGRDGFYEFILGLERLVVSHVLMGVRKDERYNDYIRVLNRIAENDGPIGRDVGVAVDEKKVVTKLKDEDLYDRIYTRYVLLRLELSAAELKDVREFTARSVEHVFPQNPEAGSEWDKMATADDRKSFVNKLGNLVLLSQGKNSAASNRPFREKKNTYLKDRVSDYPRSLQVCNVEDWNPDTIRARTEEGVELLFKDPATP